MATLKSEHFGPATAERLQADEGQGYTADRNIYLDAEGKVVEEDNPAQERQLIGKGGRLDNATAKKYGLIGKKAKAAEADEAEAEEVGGGEKASSPSANKAASPAKNKGAKAK